jgi:glycosyltransferase involved in cell wall biosynthesis
MRDRLCIAVVSPFLDKRHGTERCVAEQVERLAWEHGYEVHLYSQRVEDLEGLEEFRGDNGFHGSPDERSPTMAPAKAQSRILWHKIPDVPGPHLVKYLWWLLANQFRRRQDRRSLGLHYDLVYSPGINCFDADAIVVHIVFHEYYRQGARGELRLRNTPLRAWPRVLHRRLYYHLIIALEKRIYSNPRVTLAAVSGLVARQLQQWFGRDDVLVIPNAVDGKIFNPAARQSRREQARRRFQFKEEDFVLLLVGNDWKKKGLTCLLEAVARCGSLPLKVLVVGRDDRTHFQPLIGRLNISDRVCFAEPSADVVQFYAAADAYVGPSLEDAFGLPPAEAMACGLPVVVSSQAGMSELVQHGVNGLILSDPRNRDELGELIRLLYTQADLRRRLGENAAKAMQDYGWEANTQRTREMLESFLQRKAAGRFVQLSRAAHRAANQSGGQI